MSKTKKMTKDELLAKKRAAEKARRDKIKLNPEAYARYKEQEKERYRKRKEDKKLLSINDMTPRQKRTQRKRWKVNCRTFRERKRLDKQLQQRLADSTPPESDWDDGQLLNVAPEHEQRPILASPGLAQKRLLTRNQKREMTDLQSTPTTSRQCDSPQSDTSSMKRQLRYNANKKLMVFRKQIDQLKKQNEKLRKRIFRANYKLKMQYSESPKTKAESLLADPHKKEEVKKSLVFAEVLKNNLTNNYENLKTNKEKTHFKENIEPSLKILKKYKMLKDMNAKMTRKVSKEKKQIKTKNKISDDVISFFENDDNSRMAAGKKECITRKKEKKQKRYLQDTLINLHKKFLEKHLYAISYSLFCSLKPFWVVVPTDKDKETCICKLHENVTLLAHALWNNKIIKEKSASEVLSASVCSSLNVTCLERKCPQCVNKLPIITDFDNSIEMQYWFWQNGTKEVNTRTDTKIIKITEKRHHKGSPKAVIELLLQQLEKLFIHCANIVNQYEFTTALKKQLEPNEAVIHMDFSENYSAKYNTEIQSTHIKSV